MSNGVGVRRVVGEKHLTSALRKRELGVPALNVNEAAALLSLSAETLYRLIRQGEFPAVKFGSRYVVPTRAIDEMLTTAHETGSLVDAAEWQPSWKRGDS